MALASRILLRTRSRSTASIAPVTLAVVTSTVMLILLELFLRFGAGTYANYAEQNGSRLYRSIYAYDNPTWFHLYDPTTTNTSVKTEFTKTREINSIGLAEREVPVSKPEGEYRVIALGDSFTEGVGASYDESWVKVFERHAPTLSDRRTVRTLNAGISGSDIFFEYVLLRDRPAHYRPDMVIVDLNNSDVTDLIMRGGMERFQADGSVRVQGINAPGWEWLYGISYITRHIVHGLLGYTWVLMRPGPLAVAQDAATAQLRSAITAMSKLTGEMGARFVLVVNPHEYEVNGGVYEPAAFNALVDEVTTSDKVEVIDLLKIYARTGTLTPANSHDSYWSIDYHHNARGYALMGETIATEVARRGLMTAKHQE